MPTTKHRVAANLTDAEFGELAAMAAKYEVSLSWLNRKAILEFIERYRTEQMQLPLRIDPPQLDRAGSNLNGNVSA
jgi:hypothetical protein